MRNNYAFILLGFTFLFPQNGFSQDEIINEKEQKILETVTTILHDSHYSPIEINDDFSKAVFTTFINSLDPDKRFFLASDIVEFKKHEISIDDLIKANNLIFFNLVYNRVVKRMKETKSICTNLLEKTNDYFIDESINRNIALVDFAKNNSELKNRLRIELKYFILQKMAPNLGDAVTEENSKRPTKKFIELEKTERELYSKNLEESRYNVERLSREYFFEKYINAMVLQFDPHSQYMNNSHKIDSEIKLTGKLVGIGTRLILKNKLFTIAEIAYGGPASNSKKIDVGDVILKASEGNNVPIDIGGLTLTEAAVLMKGAIGTTLNLTLKKEDGSVKDVSIKRDVIEYKDSFAKSCVVEKNGLKLGIIDLPKFYKDFDDANNRDAAKDIKNEIAFLKKEGIEGIVIDLRNNGGGAVDTAVDITGLFIEKGPIIQIKSSKNKEILSDLDPKIEWKGPLVVLLNNDSASASEIFAAAIQDYERGIIMGSKNSYGKGTVQKTNNLDLYFPKGSEGNYGGLKTTIKKIYRINGNSTQLKGVISDIAMPDEFSYAKYGESSEKNVIVWDKIEGLPFKKYNNLSRFETVITNSKKRMAENNFFRLLDKKAAYLSKKEMNPIVDLNAKNYKLNLDASKEKDMEELNKFAEINNYRNSLIFKSTATELELIKKMPSLGDKRKEWHTSLTTDIYIDESLNVLVDMKKNLISK